VGTGVAIVDILRFGVDQSQVTPQSKSDYHTSCLLILFYLCLLRTASFWYHIISSSRWHIAKMVASLDM